MTAGQAHSRVVTGARGAVSAAHPLAVSAGTGALADGGSALDAAVAAQAVICVLMPQAGGLGGDLMALVRQPDGVVVAVNGAGRAPRALRRAGADGGASVTVPGLVDGWARAHRRWGRLPLSRVLRPAVELAEHGVPVDAALARAVATHRHRLERGGAAGWPLLDLAAGDRWRQPELAALLCDVADRGREALHAGPTAAAVVAAARRYGGELSEADLAGHQTAVGPAVAVDWAGGRLHVQPPSSQGVLLAMAARWLHRHPPAPGEDLDHLLVEVTEAAFRHRDDCARGAALLAEPLSVDRQRARRLGGPRAYLHTAGVATADAAGQVVSSLVSVFDDFGSGVYVPEAGLVLNNRAGGFTGGANAAAPGALPVHTLAPAVVELPGAALALATPGADGQVQTLLQILARMRYAGADLASAVAAPRWRSQGGELLVEDDHPGRAGLAGRGHVVRDVSAGDEVFGAAVAAGTGATGPFAAADWRRLVWSGVV
ncbi:gamma-glutamyltransferase [Micromonospora sp. RP3T]|uniref:gamma-glutamyltransferase n=1 Tax=Micromonospora sp. RP3T TaxID=2135446 RepID=UPI000D154116|nr:gamma-glutamyltransferase [Micromonospora sp. RP3T]PTA47492.1 gamma-glutamyltransferase [Micromonospora sp. RP3T]